MSQPPQSSGQVQPVVTIGALLLATLVAAFVMMLAFFVTTTITSSFAVDAAASPQESVTLASIGRGVATSGLLAPLVFVAMLPVTIVMTPVSRVLIARSRSQFVTILCGGAIGACVAMPLLTVTYFALSGRWESIASLKPAALLYDLLAPSAAAGASFTATILARSRT